MYPFFLSNQLACYNTINRLDENTSEICEVIKDQTFLASVIIPYDK
jgi:hypothetical protein